MDTTLITALTDLVQRLYSTIGELVSEDEINLDEDVDKAHIAVDCATLDYECVDTSNLEFRESIVWGLDTSIRVLKLTGVDLFICSGALVGPQIVTVPGTLQGRYIAVRPRYKITQDIRDTLKQFENLFYVKSRFLDEMFDGTYNETAIRDELRLTLENVLIRSWDGSGILIVDGPIFPLPRIVTEARSRYSRVYVGLIRERVELIERLNVEDRVVAVVKRLSRSRYLSYIVGMGSTDEHIVLHHARRYFDVSKCDTVYIGTLRIILKLGDLELEKYAGYLVKNFGPASRIVRIEALREETIHNVKQYVAALLTESGLPIPVHIADRLSRRLSASVFKFLWSIVPVSPLYESLEELKQVLSELGM